MILEKTVKLKWHPKTMKHYIDLGYIYTKTGKEFEVEIQHLTKGAYVRVNVKCETCGKIRILKYCDTQNLNDKHNCKSCSTRNGLKKAFRDKSVSNKRISFYYWCLSNGDRGKDILNRWDYDKNKCEPNTILCRGKYWFKCPSHKHNSELKDLNSIIISKTNLYCYKCRSFAQYLIDYHGDDAIEKYWGEFNTLSPWEISKGSNNYKIYIKCQNNKEHNEYTISPLDFKKGARCPFCSSKKICASNSLGNKYLKAIEVWSDLNEKTPFKYTHGSNKKVYWKCDSGIHKDYKRIINEATSCEFVCPSCLRENKESHLQRKIRLYLSKDLGYNLTHEHDCDLKCYSPKTGYLLPFDTCVNELGLYVECQGIQHTETVNFSGHFTKEEMVKRLKEIQYRDEIKRLFVLKNNLEYLAIPYTAEKNDEYKILIDNKIIEILNKRGDNNFAKT